MTVCGMGACHVSAAPYISEFVASNASGLTDEDGDTSDWIEIHNPDGSAANLQGWALTDDAGVPGKWVFPSVSVPAGGYVVVFASNKDRTPSSGELHTNFKLSSGGEYLALLDGGGVISHAFDPGFPQQVTDISYGILPSQAYGYLASPTPGAANAGEGSPGVRILSVDHAPQLPENSDDIVVSAQVEELVLPVASVSLHYRVNYGVEVILPMADNGTGNDAVSGDGVYTATIPASVSSHAQMVRWKVTTVDSGGGTSQLPLFIDQSGSNQDPEYFGTVISETRIVASLPAIYWFTQDETNS